MMCKIDKHSSPRAKLLPRPLTAGTSGISEPTPSEGSHHSSASIRAPVVFVSVPSVALVVGGSQYCCQSITDRFPEGRGSRKGPVMPLTTS